MPAWLATLAHKPSAAGVGHGVAARPVGTAGTLGLPVGVHFLGEAH